MTKPSQPAPPLDPPLDSQPQPMSRRAFLTRLATLGAAGTAAGLLAACQSTPAGSGGSGTQPVPSGAQRLVTISMWTHDQLYVDFFNLRGEVWKQNHPDQQVTFAFQQVPEVFTKVLANMAAQIEVPDLLGIEQGAFPQFMKDGVVAEKFVDLTPLIGDERSKFVEGSWTKFTDQGKIYGVDSGLCATVLYHQPEQYEQVGQQVPATWEEAATAGEALAANDSALIAFQAEANDSFTLLYWQRGGTYFDQNSDFVFDTPENRALAVEVLNYIRAGVDKGYIKPFSNADFWSPAIYAAYQDGSVNGIIMPDWYSDAQLKASAPDMTGRWRIAPMPRWQAGGLATSTWGGTGFAIYKGSANVDLTWDLLHYTYMTKESQLKRYEELRYFPTMIEALEDPSMAGVTDDYYGGQQVGQIFADIAPDVPRWYQSPIRRPLVDALNAELNGFYSGNSSAEQTLDAVYANVRQAMRFL